MITKKTTAALSVAALFLAQSALACDYPVRIKDIPDGDSSTRDEMVAGKKAVTDYLLKMDDYLNCIEAAEAQAMISLGDVDEDTKRQRKATFDKKYNAAVEEMNLVAEEFNIQLRAFNAKKK